MLHQRLVARILEGSGRATQNDRRAAFENVEQGEPLRTLIDKVAQRPTQVTDEDIAAVKASGLSEDEIFELVVCAAVGQATRQYNTALQALAEAADGHGEVGHAARDPQ
jgi:alkylhydroperoxidase family enzyme